MLAFDIKIDEKTGHKWVETRLQGKNILTTPILNKGTAFSHQERIDLGLLGKLPSSVETLEDHVNRAYQQFQCYASDLQKHIYLNNLHDKSEIVFYKLVGTYLEEMFPYVYTPGVGSAVKAFSREFRQPRGLYIAYPDIDYIDTIIDNRTHPQISMIVLTDGEGVLGIGDQGIGAMDIPVAKLVVYSLCGLDPYQALPIMIDVGTDNQALLDDHMYLGWRHKRIRGEEYDKFIDKIIVSLQKKFPNAVIHWEDFGRNTARHLLEKYRGACCTFNDDIQGTGVVSLGALLAAMQSTKIAPENQRVVVFGAGTAGLGITDQLCAALVRMGVPLEQARKQFWLIDRFGLLHQDSTDLGKFQQPYARRQSELIDFNDDLQLLNVVKTVKPTILIGASTVRHAFSEEVITTMAEHIARPIVFPLSNPTEKAEAHPEHIMNWSKGQALIATGSPFKLVKYDDKMVRIAQCNNALAFPGLGLGALAVKASTINDNMLWAAAKAIASQSPLNQDDYAPVLPSLHEAREVAYHVAMAVAKQAVKDGVNTIEVNKPIRQLIQDIIWHPAYLPIKAAK